MSVPRGRYRCPPHWAGPLSRRSDSRSTSGVSSKHGPACASPTRPDHFFQVGHPASALWTVMTSLTIHPPRL